MRRLRWATHRIRGRPAVGAVVVIAVLVSLASVAMVYVIPRPLGVTRLRNPIPTAPEFGQVNRVTRAPRDWVEAVCEMPLIELDVTCGMPIACILSCTLIGPQSRPEASNAARTATAAAFTSSPSSDGLDFGRLLLGSSTAAGPSVSARFRNS